MSKESAFCFEKQIVQGSKPRERCPWPSPHWPRAPGFGTATEIPTSWRPLVPGSWESLTALSKALQLRIPEQPSKVIFT